MKIIKIYKDHLSPPSTKNYPNGKTFDNTSKITDIVDVINISLRDNNLYGNH